MQDSLPFVRNPEINPIISESVPVQSDFVYFALTSVSGGIISCSITLHIAINPQRMEYNDVISFGNNVSDSIDIPSVYLINLIRLSKDDDFLAIRNDIICNKYVRPDGIVGHAIDYYINGCHQHLWCYRMTPLDGGPIELSCSKEEGGCRRFYTGIERTYELVRKVLVRERMDYWFHQEDIHWS